MLMRLLIRSLILLVFTIFTAFYGCKKEPSSGNKSVVIAISSDVERINPLYSFSVNEANINELLFLSLVKHTWNEEKGDLVTEPMIAKQWEWEKDSSAITIELRDDVNWSDGRKLTVDDIIFSFDIYSDPLVQSYLYGTFKNFYCDKENHIDIYKTFVKISPAKLKINFIPNSLPDLYCLDFPIVAKHIFEKVDRKNLINADENFKPVSSGAFTLEKWEKNQAIVLKRNKSSYLKDEGNVEKIYFKIVPEYTSRITQLKKGEVDLIEDVKWDNVNELNLSGSFSVIPVKGREYDYIGWNNIDPEMYSKQKKILPNKILGSSNVRKALTLAVNRTEILKELLGGYGTVANSPISPIFKNAVNSKLPPYSFNIDSAKALLAEEGWKDSDKDGILEKDGKKFKISLALTGSKPRRLASAILIKNTFKQLGVELNIEQMEGGAFTEKLVNRSFDAWMAGWSVPIPPDLSISWHSDLAKTPMNFCGFRNPQADLLLDEIEKTSSSESKNQLYKKLEQLLYNEQPVTFLYWIDNIVAFNKRIQNIDVNPLGVVHHCWKWTVK